MSECCNVSKGDFLSDLKSHKCSLCNICLVCHHCLLARGYLRKRKFDVNAMLDIISQSDIDNDPPRYIIVGPNNEIVERTPNVHVLPTTNERTYTNNQTDTYQETYPVDIDPMTDAQENDLPEMVEPVSFGGNQDGEPVSFDGNQDGESVSLDHNQEVEPVSLDKPDELVFYECDECGKILTSEQDFNMHKIYHSVEEIHECKICNRTFKYSYELIKHSLYHDDKSFICEYCDKPYATEEKLRMHMRFHTGARPYVCSVCEKAFKENAHLKSHLLIHTDERPYQCDKCGRGFRFKLKLERHYWIHDGIKPFVCLVCEKAFRHKCNLRTHVKRHHNMSLENSVQSEITDI